MKKHEEFLHSKLFRVLLPIVIVGGIISVFRAGYEAGQWLFVVLR